MEVITNEKGFKIINLNVQQMLKLGGMCICDSCNSGMFTGVFIGALNRIYCNDCYKDFEENSTYYPEDSKFESKIVDRTLAMLQNN